MQNAISLNGVSRNYGAVQALRDVTLDVPQGSAMAVLGENGAGKTTMIRVILGLASQYGGTALVWGTDVKDHLARKGVRYLPERVQFPDWATPNDVFRHMERIRKETEPARFIQSANELQCGDLVNRRFGKMSKGQRQRLALALATAGTPRMAILDEPSTGLDPLGRVLVRKTVARLAREGTTILLCSHLLGEVEQVCSHAAFLNRGSLVANDRLENLSRFTGAAEVQTPEPERMAGALSRAGFPCRMEQDAVIAALDRGDSVNVLAAAAAAGGVPFTAVSLKRETLEDVFMRVTEGRGASVP